MAKPPPPKFRIRFPWALLIVLGLYAGAVYAYIHVTYWSSNEYLAAQSYAQALLILGDDDGRRCSEKDLLRAFELTLEVARLMPEERDVAVHIEDLRGRFAERKFKLPAELVKKAEMVSHHAMKVDQERKAWLVVGARSKGWAPDQLLAGPQRTVMFSVPGAVFIVVFWVYAQFSSKAAREREHEAQLKDQEREVEDLGEFRQGLSTTKARFPKSTEVEDDSDTLAAPPPKPVQSMLRPGPSKKNLKPVASKGPRTQSSAGRPSVKRRPVEDDDE